MHRLTLELKYVLLISLAVVSCIDATAPRPRPTGIHEEPEPDSATLLWYETQPRVVTVGQNDSVRVIVAIAGTADLVNIQLRTADFVTLTRTSDGLYSGRIAANAMLFGYRTGDAHHISGLLQVTRNGRSQQTTLLINVRDATTPHVDVQTVVPGMQASARVVNLRYDSLYFGGPVPPTVLRAFYNAFPDDFEFVAVLAQVHSEHDRSFRAVRNAIAGLGISLFDNGSTYGSAATLEGILQYPRDTFYDLSETSNLHEMAHRWMNHLTHPALVSGKPHWPLSSLAYGIMGWSDPVTGENLRFPFDLVPQANGTHRVTLIDTPRAFNDLELYLMGLLPPDSVRPHIVFADQNQREDVRNGGFLRGRVDTVRIADIVARDGPRAPSSATAPRQIRVATIVLSRNGLLSREDMGFFENMAARGEQLTPLAYSDGFLRATTQPFFVATGGRGRLNARLRNEPQ